MSLEDAYESAKGRLGGMTFDEFKQALEGWTVHDLNGGAILVNGPEIHVCIVERAKGMWATKRHFEVLREVVREHGYAQTSATTDEGIRFVQRLGFEREGDKWVLRRQS